MRGQTAGYREAARPRRESTGACEGKKGTYCVAPRASLGKGEGERKPSKKKEKSTAEFEKARSRMHLDSAVLLRTEDLCRMNSDPCRINEAFCC